jgi:hypothetical protein
MEDQSTIEPWQLPTMAPPASPIFVSPPRNPKRFDDSTKSPSRDGPSIEYGVVISPIRARRGRREQAIPSNAPPSALREDFFKVLVSGDFFNFQIERKPAIKSAANLSAAEHLMEQQLSELLPASNLPPGRLPAIGSTTNLSAAGHLTEQKFADLLPANTLGWPRKPAITSTANPSAAALLMEQKLSTLLPVNIFNLPPGREPSIGSTANLSAAPRLPEEQLSVTLPSNATLPTFSLSQQPDTKEFASAFELAVPLRNRRMTSPAEMHHTRPRRMTMSSLSNLQTPFSSPQNPPAATLTVAAPAYQIRNPIDLLEVIQAHPTETFTRIQDLGRENIRLEDEIKFLRNENKFTQDSKDRAHKNHSDTMVAHFDAILRYEWCKQNLLHSCTERLENQIVQLKGGGRMVQGEWMSEASYAALEQTALDAQGGVGAQTGLGIQGENNWDELVAQKLFTEAEAEPQSPTAWNGSEEGEEVKGKGKAKEKLAPLLDPNAVGLQPSSAETWN